MLSLTQFILQLSALLVSEGIKSEEIHHIDFDYEKSEMSLTIGRTITKDIIAEIETKFECYFKYVTPFHVLHGGAGLCVTFDKKSL